MPEMTQEEIDEIYEDSQLLDSMRTDEFKGFLDYHTDIMTDTIKRISITYPNSEKKRLGDIGEEFVAMIIRWVMWDKKFKIDHKERMSYHIEMHYGAPKYSSEGGIDKLWNIYDEIDTIYRIAAEIKNWMKLEYYSNEKFDEDILERFTKNVYDEEVVKILLMNKRNIHLLSDRCKKNNIRIIPIEHQITETLGRDSLRYSIRCLYYELWMLIEGLIYDRNSMIKKLRYFGCPVKGIAAAYSLSRQQISSIIK